MNRGILATFGVAVFFAILFGSLTINSAMATPPAKVDVCHTDPDNDGAGLETIQVSERSLQKHLDHGDHTGACFVCGDTFTDPPTETCDDGANNGNPGSCNATCDGMVPVGSTCEACFVTLDADLLACGDTAACRINGHQTFATCSETCEGFADGISDVCYNQEADGFSSCLATAITQEEFIGCLNPWGNALTTCNENEV